MEAGLKKHSESGSRRMCKNSDGPRGRPIFLVPDEYTA